MKEQQIDLMPPGIRERSQAGIRAGQYALGYIVIIAVVVVLTSHARLNLSSAQREHEAARQETDFVQDTERKAKQMRAIVADLRQYIDDYHMVAYPIETSRVIATIVNVLPSSVSLDRIDIKSGPGGVARTPRSRGEESSEPKTRRWMTVELGGFAATDADIAELVARLQELSGFQNVSLDFSRTRGVYGKSARAFRLSFKVDLDATYEVVGFTPRGLMSGDSP